MNSLKKIFKRLFCLHLQWERCYDVRNYDSLANVAVYGEGYYEPYECVNCGKGKSFVDPPISYIGE